MFQDNIDEELESIDSVPKRFSKYDEWESSTTELVEGFIDKYYNGCSDFEWVDDEFGWLVLIDDTIWKLSDIASAVKLQAVDGDVYQFEREYNGKISLYTFLQKIRNAEIRRT